MLTVDDPANKDPDRKDRLTVGKPISAKVMNLLPIGTEALVRLDAAPPLRYTTHGDAPTFSAPGIEKIPARLSGSGPAYSWSEVAPNVDGTWSTLTGGRSGTSNAYEANSKTGIGANVVMLGFTSANDYRFYLPRFGGITVTITVSGCFNITQSGEAVVVKDSGGSVVATGTTNSSGQFKPSLGAGTGYTATAGGGTSRYQSNTVTFNVATGTNLVSLPLTPTTSYTCCFACGPPISKTLTLTSGGTCGGIDFPNDTLTFGPTPSWTTAFSGNIYLGATPFTVGTDTDWFYVLTCSSGLWRARMSTGSSFLLANQNLLARLCGPPFSWPITCGTNNIGCTIHD